MNKKIYVLLLLLGLGLVVRAQQKFELTGQIKDSQSKKAMEFCSVSVFNAKDSMVFNAMTNDKGFFTIPLDPGIYKVITSYLGYANDTVKQIQLSENVFLGVLKMEPTQKTLNEFTVKSNSYENQLDKDVQIVTDKLKAGTAKTTDVLDKLNGVDVDKYSNSVKVDNDAKVIILVDGVEKDQEYIKNLSPDRLKKIEITRDPGGRYALEGYSAIINIILKKDYRGTELFLSNRTMIDPDASKKESIFVQNEFSSTLNYTYNKVNIYGKYSVLKNNFNLPTSTIKEYSNGLTISKNPAADNHENTRVKQLTNDYTIGMDYYINPRHTLSIEGNLSMLPLKKNRATEMYDINYLMNGQLLSNTSSTASSESENKGYYQSIFYQGKIDDKNQINSNFTFGSYENKFFTNYTEGQDILMNEHGINNKLSTEYYIEFDHTFSAKSSFQLGYGNTWEKTKNLYNTNDITKDFYYSDFRNKIYSYYSFPFKKKIGIKIGGALETSSPDADGIDKSYITFQPYADIKYKMSDILDFKLKYRSASAYPGIEQTNPFTFTIDQNSIKTGNPNLRPEVTNKISLQMNILGGLASIEPYFHFSKNLITESGNLINDSIFEYSYSNAGHYKNYGLEMNFTVPIGKKIYWQNNLDIFNSSIDFNEKINNIHDWTLSSQLIYYVEKTGFVAGCQYQNFLRKYITAQGYNKGENDFWIAFVQKPFFKQRLNVMLLYFAPIGLGVDFNQGSYISTENYTEIKNNDLSFLKNMLMLQVSYRFNKGKQVSKTERIREPKKEKGSKGLL